METVRDRKPKIRYERYTPDPHSLIDQRHRMDFSEDGTTVTIYEPVVGVFLGGDPNAPDEPDVLFEPDE